VNDTHGIHWTTRTEAPGPAVTAIARNNQTALVAQAGDLTAALEGFRQALAIDLQSLPARFNLGILEDALAEGHGLLVGGVPGALG
jgi:hypothetical protein